jgi:hypothetical protein
MAFAGPLLMLPYRHANATVPSVTRRRILKWLAVAVVLIILILSVLPGNRRPMDSYMGDSFERMRTLAMVLSDYAGDHDGSLPKKWSDLIPNDADYPNERFLFNSPYSEPVKNVDLQAHPELTDRYTPYRYMKLADGRIVVVEKPGFWKDGKITYCLMGPDGVPVGNFQLCHVTPEEFARRVASNFPDIPDGNSEWEEADYHGGYVLVLDRPKLQGIHKAFLASSKAPISQEAARASAQAAVDRMDASLKCVVDSGVRTSDGSTPYYHFKCQFPKAMQETYNPMDVYVLFDGTVIAPTKEK